MSRFVDQHLSEVNQTFPACSLVQAQHADRTHDPHHHVSHLPFYDHHTQATFTPMAASVLRVSAITSSEKDCRSSRPHICTRSSVVEAAQTQVNQANGAAVHTDTDSDVQKTPAKQFQWLKQVGEK